MTLEKLEDVLRATLKVFFKATPLGESCNWAVLASSWTS